MSDLFYAFSLSIVSSHIAYFHGSAIVLPIMVVRMRINSSQTKQRRSHHGLKAPVTAVCNNCGAQHRPHHMCLDCGFYNGRQVLDLAAEKTKREARLKAKKEMIKGQQSDEEPLETEAVEAPAEVIEESTEKVEAADKKAS